MVRSQRILVIAWAIGLATCAIGQGGQQGGFGGGGGGNFQGETRALILTPGQVAEWDLKLEPNEYIVARASSQVFDPVIQIRDKDGKVLKENDDVELGEQDAVVSDFFPKGFEGKVIVKCFKEAAGGPFQLNLRRSKGVLMQPGRKTSFPEFDDRGGLAIFDMKKGSQVFVSAMGSSVPLIQPDGYSNLYPGVKTTVTNYSPYTAKMDGYHGIFVGGPDQGAMRVLAPAVKALTLNSSSQHVLSATSVDTFPVNLVEGQVITIQARGKQAKVYPDLVPSEEIQSALGGGNPINLESRIFVSTMIKSSTYLVPKTGSYHILVSSESLVPVDYEVLVSDAAPNVTSGQTLSKTIEIGQAHFFRIKGKLGDRIRVRVDGNGFMPALELNYLRQSNLVLSALSDDLKSCQIDTILTQDGEYVVEVGSMGGGGAGSYSLRFEVHSEPPTPQGQVTKVGGTESSLRRMELKKGQLILIHFPNPGSARRISIIHNGSNVNFAELKRVEGQPRLLYFEAHADGSYFVRPRDVPGAPIEFFWTTIQSP